MPQKPKRPCRYPGSVRIISCGVVIDSAEVLRSKDMTEDGEKRVLCS